MTILNLYAGIGGNRKLWGDSHTITAIEHDTHIAAAYKSLFPNDTVIVADAHQYLLDHYDEFDFIWSSPPCPSHGQYRFNVGVRAKGYTALFPDMGLYEEILLLKHYYKSNWVVENVKPYYEPLVPPTAILQRHLFWASFAIPALTLAAKDIRSKNKIGDYDDLGFNVSDTPIKNKRQVLRNAVEPSLGKHILESLWNGTTIFDEPKPPMPNSSPGEL